MKEFYLFTCIFIGLVSMYDGYMLYKAKGQVIRNKIVVLTSCVEFLWSLLTFYVLFTVNFSSIEILVPVLFAAHNVIGWIYSLVFYPIPENATPLELLDIQIPRWYTVFGLCFGIVFTVTSSVVFALYS